MAKNKYPLCFFGPGFFKWLKKESFIFFVMSAVVWFCIMLYKSGPTRYTLFQGAILTVASTLLIVMFLVTAEISRNLSATFTGVYSPLGGSRLKLPVFLTITEIKSYGLKLPKNYTSDKSLQASVGRALISIILWAIIFFTLSLVLASSAAYLTFKLI